MNHTKKIRALLLLSLCAFNLFQTGVVLALADDSQMHGDVTQRKPLKPGVSAALDSPEPLAFRQITQFITENYGVVKVDGFDKIQNADAEEEIPVWHIRERLKRSAKATEL